MTDFEPTGLGKTIFEDRYARSPEEAWGQACLRVASHVAEAEDNGKVAIYTQRFHDQLISNKFCPGGRIWYGSGRPKAQLLNCFVVPTADSREGWAKTASDVIIISSLMGGVGINVSPVRPRGAVIKGTGGHSTGSVSLMQLIDRVGDVIVGGGGRRMALMLCLDINHPDMEEFLESKLDLNQLNNANISLMLPPGFSAEHFVELIENDGDIELIFNGIESGKSIKAKQLWDRLVENAWTSGEPGILNGDLANTMNNIWYHQPLISTNPCVTGDTWVQTRSGPRRAADLVGVYTSIVVDGQTYYSSDGFYSTGVKPVYTLSTKEGYTLNLTSNHRVLLEDGQWVEAGSLRDGDKIVLNNHDLAPYWSGVGIEQEGYLVGHFLGDGTWESKKARICSWGDTKGEKAVREYISNSLSWSGAEWQSQKSGAYFLKDDSIVEKYVQKRTKNITDRIETASSLFYKGFLKGLFDTDGHVEGDSHGPGISVRLSQSNLDFLTQVQRMLLRFGIRSKINKARDAGPRRLPDGQGGYSDYETKTSYRLIITSDCDRYMQYIGFNNTDKIDKYQTARSWMTKGFYNKPWTATFESLEYIGEHEVFDITVHGLHAFDANGLYVHNCGEIFLEKYGCCDLGALVLPRFVKNGIFNWDEFDESVRLGTRFLDNVLTVNHYPLPEIKENCDNVRRVGLGVMGLHTMLLELGLRYDDPKSFEFVDQLFSTLKNTAYDASINLAIEKGPFAAYDPRFLESGFAKTLKRGIRNKIKEHGIRNCAILTIAPTGTTSMVSGVSSGIEPLPPSVYWRNYFKPSTNGHRELAKELVVEESFYKYPDLVQSAIDVPVRSHFEMQKTVQKHIDNAVSKTINLAQDFPKDAFGGIWLEYLPYLKGTTVYRYGSRENEPINPVPRDQWEDLVAEKILETETMTAEEFLALDCPDGVCELPLPKQEEVTIT